jgi:hypothetical protein
MGLFMPNGRTSKCATPIAESGDFNLESQNYGRFNRTRTRFNLLANNLRSQSRSLLRRENWEPLEIRGLRPEVCENNGRASRLASHVELASCAHHCRHRREPRLGSNQQIDRDRNRPNPHTRVWTAQGCRRTTGGESRRRRARRREQRVSSKRARADPTVCCGPNLMLSSTSERVRVAHP